MMMTDVTLFPVTAAEYGRLEYRRKIEMPVHWSMPPARFDGEYLNRFGVSRDAESIRCPFTPGQVLAIQEEYKLVRPETGDIVADFGSPAQVRYYADDNPRYRDRDDDWQPASTLPLWAVRRRERVTAVSVDGGEWVVRTQEWERE